MSSFNDKSGSSLLIMFSLQVHGFWQVQDAILTVLGREEVAPRTSIALALSGVTLDPMMELQDVKGFKAGVTLRLVEGKLQETAFLKDCIILNLYYV